MSINNLPGQAHNISIRVSLAFQSLSFQPRFFQVVPPLVPIVRDSHIAQVSDSFSLFRPYGCALRRQSQPSVTARGKHSLLKTKTQNQRSKENAEPNTNTNANGKTRHSEVVSFTRGSGQQARPDHEGIQRVLELFRRKSNPRAYSMSIARHAARANQYVSEVADIRPSR